MKKKSNKMRSIIWVIAALMALTMAQSAFAARVARPVLVLVLPTPIAAPVVSR
jgi:hypothetical protein